MNTTTNTLPFTTQCPAWCTINAEGLEHSEDIVLATGALETTHQNQGIASADGRFTFYLIQEDHLLEGVETSRTYLWLSGPDSGELTIAQALELSDMAKTATELWAGVLA